MSIPFHEDGKLLCGSVCWPLLWKWEKRKMARLVRQMKRKILVTVLPIVTDLEIAFDNQYGCAERERFQMCCKLQGHQRDLFNNNNYAGLKTHF